MIRKTDAMHLLFGTDTMHTCADCDHLCSKLYDRRYYKCEVYGDSNSEATDWAKRWTACGLINNMEKATAFTDEWGTVMHYLKTHRKKEPEPQIDGQICLEDLI